MNLKGCYIFFSLAYLQLQPQSVFPQKMNLTKSHSWELTETMVYGIFECTNSAYLKIGIFWKAYSPHDFKIVHSCLSL